jgi:beta-glucanase (GH16 family)
MFPCHKIIHPLFIFLILSGLCSCKAYQPAAKSFEKEGYKLVWADEFNKDGAVNSNNWQFEKGFMRNQEFQWYQEDNAWCEKGFLIIEGRREQKPNPVYQAGSTEWRKKNAAINYTSSSIKTSGKHSWQYGRFIMRGRINIDAGLWPAWWTLGVKGPWPSNGEIDIMEYYSNKVLANVATGTSQPNKAKWFTVIKPADSLGGKEWASKFHTWRMDWDEREISLYLDDVLMNNVPLSKLVNEDGSNINPFNQPHYMLLNLAIGGTQGGDPANTKFPNRFEVDYVRVYQRQ